MVRTLYSTLIYASYERQTHKNYSDPVTSSESPKQEHQIKSRATTQYLTKPETRTLCCPAIKAWPCLATNINNIDMAWRSFHSPSVPSNQPQPTTHYCKIYIWLDPSSSRLVDRTLEYFCAPPSEGGAPDSRSLSQLSRVVRRRTSTQSNSLFRRMRPWCCYYICY